MADIRKREGNKGTTYQVRYPSRASKTGYAYKTFETLKEARHYLGTELPKHKSARHHSIRKIGQAVDKWLDICEHEGREGRDPVAGATLAGYKWRAAIINEYQWTKELYELETADCIAFRSWLVRNYSRDTAKKVLSSFHSVLLEMVGQGVLSTDPAATISIQQSRYQEPVQIPSVDEIKSILKAADELANDKNYWIAKAWNRYRPMIYLAADSGMRPQEYLALPVDDVLKTGVRITQALDSDSRIGPPKTRAARRFIPVSPDTLDMLRRYQKSRKGPNKYRLCFPGEDGGHQQYRNYLRRGWDKLMEKAGLMVEEKVGRTTEVTTMYKPYSLRHFYASVLIAQNTDLKTLQERMGHQDAAMTLDVYGHLIRLRQAEAKQDTGILSTVLAA